MKLASRIEIDHTVHEVRIDGIVFPWYVQEDPQVDAATMHEYPVNVVHLAVLADNVEVITTDGIDRFTPDGNVAEYARRLVREGLLERLPWLRLD